VKKQPIAESYNTNKMKKQLINEVRRWQKLAGILNESKTLAEVPEDELGTIFDKPKQWVGKELTIIDGEFAKKYPAYKNTKATFVSYNN